MSNRFLFTARALFVALVLCSVDASAQLFSSFSLRAVVTEKQTVNLMWSQPKDSGTHTFKVWRGILTGTAYIDTTVVFTNVITTTDTFSVDTPRVTAPTSFIYVVKTLTSKGQTIRSYYATVRVYPVLDKVTFTSTAPTVGRVGILYSYQLAAVSNDTSARLWFKFLWGPSGMTVDSAGGLVKWTPANRGYFVAVVGAFSTKGGRSLQEFSISVAAGNGTVTGIVVDSATGKGLRRVSVNLFEKDKGFHLGYHAVTNDTGYYLIKNVDPGSYYAQAYPFNPHYLPQWYDHVRSRAFATSFAVADSPSVTTINFALLTDSLHLPVYRARGVVTDTLGNGLKGALVVWARAEFALNGSRSDADDSSKAEGARESLDPNNPLPSTSVSMDADSRWLYRAVTDSAGRYSLRLPRGFYIIRASKPGYFKLFYNNKSNLFMADIFNLKTDTTNINFALRPVPPVPLGEITGSVIDTAAKKGVAARVIAFREWWSVRDTVAYYRHFVTDTDSLGGYVLDQLPPGVYRVFAVPLGQYAPSFYTASGTPTLRWRLATTVNINGSAVSGINIYVRPILRSAAGYTSINGSVSSTSAPGVLGKRSASFSVTGGFVYAVDTNGNVAGYGTTDASGNYTITGIAPSTYTLTMDSHDYLTASVSNVSPTYDASGNAVPATQNLTTGADVTTVESGSASAPPTNYSLEQNYPNPFNPTTQIQFALPQNDHVRLSIFNILGQKVATVLDENVAAGTHVVTWNGRNDRGITVASGVYFYQLATPNFTSIRKMVMLK